MQGSSCNGWWKKKSWARWSEAAHQTQPSDRSAARSMKIKKWDSNYSSFWERPSLHALILSRSHWPIYPVPGSAQPLRLCRAPVEYRGSTAILPSCPSACTAAALLKCKATPLVVLFCNAVFKTSTARLAMRLSVVLLMEEGEVET